MAVGMYVQCVRIICEERFAVEHIDLHWRPSRTAHIRLALYPLLLRYEGALCFFAEHLPYSKSALKVFKLLQVDYPHDLSTMGHASCDNQTFFDPQSAAGKKPKPTSPPQNWGRSVTSPGGSNWLEQDARDYQQAPAPFSADTILISSGSESCDDYDGRSDTSFPPVDDLNPRHVAKSDGSTGSTSS